MSKKINKERQINHEAWSQSLIGFIRSKGLECELTDWCGGWKCPIPGAPAELKPIACLRARCVDDEKCLEAWKCLHPMHASADTSLAMPQNVEVSIQRMRTLADSALGSLYEVECQREMRNACVLLENAYSVSRPQSNTPSPKSEIDQ